MVGVKRVKPWVLRLPLRIIYEAALVRRVEPELIAAFTSVESGGNSNATRYESHYRYTFDEAIFAKRNQISVDTETIQQKTSWGLMQIMGGVAREHGYLGALVELSNSPQLGLSYSIAHLLKFIEKYDDLESAVCAYNQGGNYRKPNGEFKNQEYVDKIMNRYKYMKEILI